MYIYIHPCYAVLYVGGFFLKLKNLVNKLNFVQIQTLLLANSVSELPHRTYKERHYTGTDCGVFQNVPGGTISSDAAAKEHRSHPQARRLCLSCEWICECAVAQEGTTSSQGQHQGIWGRL